MQPDVVQKLLNLNQTFYDTVAQSFSHTRKMINNGFDDLLTATPENADGFTGCCLRQRPFWQIYV